MSKYTGKALLNQSFLNKGTAFTENERTRYRLHGLLPTQVQTLHEQITLEYKKIIHIEDDYDKNKYLMSLYNQNRTLYYALISQYVTELLPVIYTPTIADAVTNYSADYLTPDDAVFLDTDHPEQIREALTQASADIEQVDLLVITDGEGVLGIGDWGIGGVMISVGKLTVYTVAAGVDPRRTLPIVIDNGTNRAELLSDPHYLGKRKKRKGGTNYLAFIEKLIHEAEQLFPNVLFHWEDFGRDNASVILEKYQGKTCTFNDDIQGTGVMMAAAVDAISQVTNKAVTDHKFIIFGAGTAGIGVTDQIALEMRLQGLSETEINKHFFLVDRNGLITDDMAELTAGQKRYAKKKSEFPEPITKLTDIIDAIQPSVLIGTSGQAGAFTKEVVTKMADYNEKPAILPISNPTKLCEAKASDIIHWTNGKALVVTGSPSEPVKLNGITYKIGQANNALLYPGLGLGIVVAKAKTVTDKMLSAAAHGIASLQDLDKPGASILPPIELVQSASELVAEAVVKAAIEDGVNLVSIDNAREAVKKAMWTPKYSN